MKKKVSILILGLASIFAVGINAENTVPTAGTQNTTQTQQVKTVTSGTEYYCGPQTCITYPCYTDTVCNGTPSNPVPCAPVPCNSDTVCAPVPCAPVPAPAVVNTGCGGC